MMMLLIWIVRTHVSSKTSFCEEFHDHANGCETFSSHPLPKGSPTWQLYLRTGDHRHPARRFPELVGAFRG